MTLPGNAPEQPAPGEPLCGPTHHTGCACHEARRDAREQALTADRDELLARINDLIGTAYNKRRDLEGKLLAAEERVSRLTERVVELETENERLRGRCAALASDVQRQSEAALGLLMLIDGGATAAELRASLAQQKETNND